MNKQTEQTYAESQGRQPFDWNQFLSTEEHTDEEWEEASWLAAEWPTCACGNQCSIIPRDYMTGKPEDMTLYCLGMVFSNAIDGKSVQEAKEILMKIEKRSAELIAKIRGE